MGNSLIIFLIILVVLVIIPLLVTPFLRTVEAGSIRMVSWLGGTNRIYRGPGKSYEIPLLTTGTTLSSKAINVDLDITDQTADLDDHGSPQPIKVRVLASAIVSVGDSDELIKTGANRYFSKPQEEQTSILIDLLSSSGRRAINLLTHDQLFSAKTAPRHQLSSEESDGAIVPAPTQAIVAAEEDDDPLAIIIRKACSRELTDLGLIFNSLNIKVVQSEVAEARRRQSAAEAQANADIVSAQQTRRAKEAQLEADRVISDRQRELEQTKASNAGLIAEAEAKKQDALSGQRQSELRATDIVRAQTDADRVRIAAQAEADRAKIAAQADSARVKIAAEAEADRMRISAQAEADQVRIAAEANANAQAVQIRTVAEANADAIQKVNESILAGGDTYFRYRQIELLPTIAPAIANALAQARLVTISGENHGEGAAGSALENITGVIQAVLATQLITKTGVLDGATPNGASDMSRPAGNSTPAALPASAGNER